MRRVHTMRAGVVDSAWASHQTNAKAPAGHVDRDPVVPASGCDAAWVFSSKRAARSGL